MIILPFFLFHLSVQAALLLTAGGMTGWLTAPLFAANGTCWSTAHCWSKLVVLMTLLIWVLATPLVGTGGGGWQLNWYFAVPVSYRSFLSQLRTCLPLAAQDSLHQLSSLLGSD